MMVSQMPDDENDESSEHSIKQTTSRHPLMGDSSTYTTDHLMPLYSGLYALHFTLHGGKLANSGAVSTEFHDLLRRLASQPNSMAMPQGRPIELHNRSETKPVLRTNQNTGLVLIWIHMSDGITIVWNLLKEVCFFYQDQML